jgi:hypothetical protein
MNDPGAVERAREIARRTFEGELDPLVACRDLATLRTGLLNVPKSTFDTFVALASEIDALPVGRDRQHWAPDALKTKDAEAADYRARVKDGVVAALKELVVALELQGE